MKSPFAAYVSLVSYHNENHVFLAMLHIWVISVLSNKVMVDKSQNHIFYCILKTRMMQASDNSVPSWTRVEILKEIFKSDQA